MSGAYTTLGNYPDEEFNKIVAGAVDEPQLCLEVTESVPPDELD